MGAIYKTHLLGWWFGWCLSPPLFNAAPVPRETIFSKHESCAFFHTRATPGQIGKIEVDRQDEYIYLREQCGERHIKEFA